MSSQARWLTIRGVNDERGSPISLVISGAQIIGRATYARAALDITDRELDLGGAWTVVTGMAEPHAHIDKAYVAGTIDAPVADLRTAVEAFERSIQRGLITREECEARAARALEQAITMGCTAIRTHVDCGVETAFDHMSAVEAAHRPVADQIELQKVALVYQPLVGSAATGNRRVLTTALENGVDVIGAAPQFAEDSHAVIDYLLTVAEESRRPLDLHLDETVDPSANDLEYLARRVIERGFPQQVTASHCVSLGFQELAHQQRVAALVAEAGISIVALPQTNLLLQARSELVAKPRAITSIRVLLDAGVVVAAGSDNTQDHFNPLGRLDPLETASLMISAGQATVEEARLMVTTHARSSMGLEPCELRAGARAHFSLVPGRDFREAVADGGFGRINVRAERIVRISNDDVPRVAGERRPSAPETD